DATYVALGKADGTFSSEIITATTSFAANSGWGSAQYERVVGDVNGDGRVDIIGFLDDATYVALGKTDGTFSSAITATTSFAANSGWGSAQYERVVGDVNGDGRVDIVGFGDNATFVALGKADGTFSSEITATTSFAASSGWGSAQYERVVADINGDGRADIVG
ncbi:FG-GAP repeat domain-containing protein, partial [Pseudovibrio japonicus]|uniref:FG-GAP repeat domain-containing protein n=1 Tax=Pseudovibrio japonicus TaxID=366534 RepID=UPI00188D2EF6